MSTTYIDYSEANETLDCLMYRNNCFVSLEIIMELNPHLASLSAVLPYNTPVNLPYQQPKPSPKVVKSINLWS